MVTKDTNPKDAIGIKKPTLTTIPFPVLFEVGAAMVEGACKYRQHNYRVAGVRHSVYINAAMRHLAAFWEGETIDKDSGINHLSKAIASLVVLRDSQMQGNDQDDRPPRSDEDWMKEAQNDIDAVLARYPNPLPPYTQEGLVDEDFDDDDNQEWKPRSAQRRQSVGRRSKMMSTDDNHARRSGATCRRENGDRRL